MSSVSGVVYLLVAVIWGTLALALFTQAAMLRPPPTDCLIFEVQVQDGIGFWRVGEAQLCGRDMEWSAIYFPSWEAHNEKE